MHVGTMLYRNNSKVIYLEAASLRTGVPTPKSPLPVEDLGPCLIGAYNVT